MSGLREAARPRVYRAAPRLAEVVGALGHSQPFVDVEPEALAPCGQHFLRQMLPGAHAVPQRRHVGASKRRMLHDLAVEGWNTDEGRRLVLGDELRPDRGVARTFVHDRG